jgi:hypothetical protein
MMPWPPASARSRRPGQLIPYNLAVALAYGAVVDQMRHDHPGLRDTLRELRELCDRYDLAYYREWG